MNDDDNYPKSKTGLQCLTPCYPPNTWTIHPTTLRYHTSNKPYCHVGYKVNEDTGTIDEIDECYNPIDSDNIADIDINTLVPLIDINCKYFLIIFYNLRSIEDIMEYLDKKKYTSLRTRERIVNCFFQLYYSNIELIDERLIDFFIELSKKKWSLFMYNEFNEYIYADENIVKFIDKDHNNLKYNDYRIERINYLVLQFFNHDEIYKFIYRYLNFLQTHDEVIDDYIFDIKNRYSDYIHSKIINTIENN